MRYYIAHNVTKRSLVNWCNRVVTEINRDFGLSVHQISTRHVTLKAPFDTDRAGEIGVADYMARACLSIPRFPAQIVGVGKFESGEIYLEVGIPDESRASLARLVDDICGKYRLKREEFDYIPRKTFHITLARERELESCYGDVFDYISARKNRPDSFLFKSLTLFQKNQGSHPILVRNFKFGESI